MKPIELINEEPLRLDKALSEQLGYSRSKIQKAIREGFVLVNGEVVPVKELVSKRDRIEISLQSLEPEKSIHEAPTIDVLYEDDDVIVVNKPAGLLMHETEVSDEPTLAQGLIAHFPEIVTVGDKPERPGMVQRLDKLASGVVIVAKTQAAFDVLKARFKARNVTKKYTVLVHGKMEEPVGTIKMPIGRSKSSGRMAARPESQGGKSAVTHYEVIEQFPHHALLDVRIETGRTHQIRAHFFALKHPVAGDSLYKQRNQKRMDINRIFLHANELTIALPNGEEKTFVAPLPKELEDVLELIPKT